LPRSPESKLAGPLVDVAVCVVLSLFVQVTAVPTFTFTAGALNANPEICTVAPSVGVVGTATLCDELEHAVAPKVSATTAAVATGRRDRRGLIGAPPDPGG
jgi:hypothetical protein